MSFTFKEEKWWGTLEWFTTKCLNMQNIRFIELSFPFNFSLSLSHTHSTYTLSLTLTLFYFFCCLCQPWKAFRQMWITACLPACHTLSAYGFIGNWGEEKEEERWKFNQYLFNIHLNLLLSTTTKKSVFD